MYMKGIGWPVSMQFTQEFNNKKNLIYTHISRYFVRAKKKKKKKKNRIPNNDIRI